MTNPSGDWETSAPGSDVDSETLDSLVTDALGQPAELGLTLAVAAVHRGRIVTEAYGPETTHESTLISWSMAKSMTQTVFGLLTGDGLVDIDEPAPVAAWAGDERRRITIRHLLRMTSGLEFNEDYVDAGQSHVIEMLFGAGADDHAAYAASFPLVHPPGTVWNYSSGTSNILARIAGDIIGGGRDGMERFLRTRLFEPLGMSSATPKFDTSGTFVGSSYVYATARDFARYGTLHLADGWWNGVRLLPEGWVDSAREPIGAEIPADERHGYGSHWWLWRRDPAILMASGYEGQRVIVDPGRDLVLVRLGKSPAELGPAVDEWIDRVRRCFPVAVPPAST